jgi:hypothetical protein
MKVREYEMKIRKLLFFCLLLPMFFLPAKGRELGRLFFTPEYRAILDRQRQSSGKGEAPLSINGVVTRSSGRRTVWINGLAQDDPQLPVSEIRVGDTLDPHTGKSADLLNGGKIQIKPAPLR